MVDNVENVGFCVIGDVRVSLSKTDNRIDGVKKISDFGMQRVLVVVEVWWGFKVLEVILRYQQES